MSGQPLWFSGYDRNDTCHTEEVVIRAGDVQTLFLIKFATDVFLVKVRLKL